MKKTIYQLMSVFVAFALTFGSYASASASSANAPQTAAATYYVSTSGNDASAGTSSAPFKTIQKCITVSQTGDTCSVQAGTYSERLNLNKAITVICVSARTCIIKGAALASNAVINGFYSLNSDTNDGAITGSGSGYKIINNKVEGSCMVGIKLNGSNGLAENNEVLKSRQCSGSSGPDADGFRFFGNNHIMRGNYIHDINFDNSPTAHIDCFQTWSGASSVLIENNVCDNYFAHVGGEEGSQGANIEDCNGCTFKNNYIHVYGKSILFESSASNSVANNNILVSGPKISGAGSDQYGLFGKSSANNNLFWNFSSPGETLVAGASGTGNIINKDPKMQGFCSTAYPDKGIPCGGVAPTAVPPTVAPTNTPVIVPSATPTSMPTKTATPTLINTPTATRVAATTTSVPSATPLPPSPTPTSQVSGASTASPVPASATPRPASATPTSSSVPASATPIPATPIASSVPASATPVPATPTASSVPASATSVPATPTASSVPASATPVPATPTASSVPASATPIPATPTASSVPASATPIPATPTASSVPASATPIPATPIASAVPASATPVPANPTATLEPVMPTSTSESLPPEDNDDGEVNNLPSGTVYDDKDSAFVYSRGWKNVNRKKAYGGSYKETTKDGAYVTFTFTGQSFSVIYKGGQTLRKIDVYVDGLLVGTINEKGRSAFQKSWDYPGQLTLGAHTLKLVFVTGNNSHKTGATVDAVIVR